MTKVLELDIVKKAKHLGVYMSMSSGEVDTQGLVNWIYETDRKLYIPRIVNGDIKLCRLDKNMYSRLQQDKWGIPSLSDNMPCIEHELDVIVVPGVAFDRTRARLGHGKGYYDRFLAKNSCTTIALSLRAQLIQNGKIKMQTLDYRPQMIITPDEIIQQE
jgi:5-formyltetrahydrofolate cyclo-ligase